MSNYRRGRALEYEVIDYLEARGWDCSRSAGSKGKVDVSAVKLYRRDLWIQCKTDGKIGVNEWNALFAHASTHSRIPVLANKVRGGIELWRILDYCEPRRARPKLPLEPEYVGEPTP